MEDQTKESIRFRTEIVKLLVIVMVTTIGGLLSLAVTKEDVEGELALLIMGFLLLATCLGTTIVQMMIITKLDEQWRVAQL